MLSQKAFRRRVSRILLRTGLLVGAALLSAASPRAAAAQDRLTLGNGAVAAGETVAVPIVLRDRPGTPLGADQPPGNRIRGLSITVRAEPALAVTAVGFRRAGITAGLEPRFETEVSSVGQRSWILSFPTPLNPGGTGNALVGEILVTLAADAAPGAAVDLILAAGTTALSNGDGSRIENVAAGNLDLANGTVTVLGEACTTETILCLSDDRFRLEVNWRDFNGNTGVGRPVVLTRDSGYFWFFNRDNVEIVVKTLDARAINGFFWVFYGSLTNVEFSLTVTDVVTGASKEFGNELGGFASVGDTEALPGEGSLAPVPLHAVAVPEPIEKTAKGAAGSCTADAATLCLLDDRFELRLDWRDFDGNGGTGRAIPLTRETGYFWFFNADNVEIVVKTLDARSINGHFWVFYGALTNVEFTLTVTDTVTGDVREFSNRLGRFASVGDTQAF